jgi:hypothetical protein
MHRSYALLYIARRIFIRYDNVSNTAESNDIPEQATFVVEYVFIIGLLVPITRISSGPRRQTHLPINGRGVRLQHTAP